MRYVWHILRSPVVDTLIEAAYGAIVIGLMVWWAPALATYLAITIGLAWVVATTILIATVIGIHIKELFHA